MDNPLINERELWIEEILARMRDKREAAPALPEHPTPQSNCPDLADVMDVVLGTAAPEVVRRVEEHLPECDYCRACFAAYLKAIRNEQEPEPEMEGSVWEEMTTRPDDLVVDEPRPVKERAGDPADALAEPAPLGPGYTQKALRGDTSSLAADLRPWVPFLLQRLGVAREEAEHRAEQVLGYIVGRVGEVTPQRRFRDLLPGWLADYAATQGIALALPALTTPEWENLLRAASDEEAVTWVLSRDLPDEPEEQRAFRGRVLRLRPQTPRFLREYRSEEEQSGDRAIARFRRDLAAQSEQRQQERYSALELTAA